MTNKDLLDKIYREQQGQAKQQLKLAGEFSTYMNKTDLKLAEIIGHLESNSKTNTKGVIEQQAINTKDIANFKTDKKIIYSIGIFVTVGINFFFKYLWK